MSSYQPDPDLGAHVYAMDRAHVFHSWSAQKALKPLAIAAAGRDPGIDRGPVPRDAQRDIRRGLINRIRRPWSWLGNAASPR